MRGRVPRARRSASRLARRCAEIRPAGSRPDTAGNGSVPAPCPERFHPAPDRLAPCISTPSPRRDCARPAASILPREKRRRWRGGRRRAVRRAIAPGFPCRCRAHRAESTVWAAAVVAPATCTGPCRPSTTPSDLASPSYCLSFKLKRGIGVGGSPGPRQRGGRPACRLGRIAPYPLTGETPVQTAQTSALHGSTPVQGPDPRAKSGGDSSRTHLPATVLKPNRVLAAQPMLRIVRQFLPSEKSPPIRVKTSKQTRPGRDGPVQPRMDTNGHELRTSANFQEFSILRTMCAHCAPEPTRCPLTPSLSPLRSGRGCPTCPPQPWQRRKGGRGGESGGGSFFGWGSAAPGSVVSIRVRSWFS